MYIEPAMTEIVFEIRDNEQQRMLQDHFTKFYSTWTPDVQFEGEGEIWHSRSNIPYPFFNATFGYSDIDAEIAFFKETPFIWFLDGEGDPEFKEKLLLRGFQDAGIFQGMIALLDSNTPLPNVPEGCTLELVKDEATMQEFSEIVSEIFELQGESKDLYKKALQNNPNLFHWLGRKNGKAVSALSTLIDGNIVSFWNGASLPESRRQGLATALGLLALQDAQTKGCTIATSYLTSEGMALGIATKHGAQTKWKFHTFISPPN